MARSPASGVRRSCETHATSSRRLASTRRSRSRASLAHMLAAARRRPAHSATPRPTAPATNTTMNSTCKSCVEMNISQAAPRRDRRAGRYGRARWYGWEVCVGTDAVGELGHGEYAGASAFAPQGFGFEPVKQPVPEGFRLLDLPGRGGPATLVLGSLDERDVRPLLDDLDAPFDDPLVRLWPMRGNVRDRRGTVAREPLGLGLTGCHLAGQHDLKGAFAQLESWYRVFGRGQVLVQQPI